jgi:hypothetical protein
MQLKHKLGLSLLAYAALAVLAWQTLSEFRLRAFVWLVMGLFAVKSLLYWYARRELPIADRQDEQRELDR